VVPPPQLQMMVAVMEMFTVWRNSGVMAARIMYDIAASQQTMIMSPYVEAAEIDGVA